MTDTDRMEWHRRLNGPLAVVALGLLMASCGPSLSTMEKDLMQKVVDGPWELYTKCMAHAKELPTVAEYRAERDRCFVQWQHDYHSGMVQIREVVYPNQKAFTCHQVEDKTYCY
jgi:hypothetical protein